MADTVHYWNWVEGQNSVNDNGGDFKSISASFNADTNELIWSATFGDAPNGRKTDGMTLVLNNGPNPKGHAGELAVFYFDADDENNPILTAYAYNGQNSTNSYRDGNGAVGGNQTPDFIGSSQAGDTSWVLGLDVVDHANGLRTLTMHIDATIIRDHSPMYPGNTPWYGTGFDTKLGLWFHTFTGSDFDYNHKGKIWDFDYKSQGWFDGSNFDTTMIPLPAPVYIGAAGLVGLVIAQRRRKKNG